MKKNKKDEKIHILRKYIRDQGLTITAFSKKIGYSQPTLQNIMKGRSIDLATAIAIEDATYCYKTKKNIVTCRDLLAEIIQSQYNRKVLHVGKLSSKPSKNELRNDKKDES